MADIKKPISITDKVLKKGSGRVSKLVSVTHTTEATQTHVQRPPAILYVFFYHEHTHSSILIPAARACPERPCEHLGSSLLDEFVYSILVLTLDTFGVYFLVFFCDWVR